MSYIQKKLAEKYGFTCEDIIVEALGLVDTNIPNSITFIDDLSFLEEALNNLNIVVILVSKDLIDIETIDEKSVEFISVDDSRFEFFTLQNEVANKKLQEKRFKSKIEESSKVHKTAYVSDYNVVIGKNVIIEPNVTIMENVTIGDDSYVSAGTVIGAEGFEHKRTSKGIVSVRHDGQVIIGEKVFIGSLNGISKGFSFRNTMIGDETKTDNLVHIAHCAQIGKRCFLPASTMIGGSVSIGDDVWIGPNVSISSQVKLGDRSFVTLGSVVIRDVKKDQHVSGNFAIDHIQFLKVLNHNMKL